MVAIPVLPLIFSSFAPFSLFNFFTFYFLLFTLIIMITTEKTSALWREHLHLQPHFEGGAFRETYHSSWILHKSTLPPGMKGNRNAATCIYFLLEKGGFSALHRIAADEIWHFYDGVTLSIYEIDPQGGLTVHKLGRNVH